MPNLYTNHCATYMLWFEYERRPWAPVFEHVVFIWCCLEACGILRRWSFALCLCHWGQALGVYSLAPHSISSVCFLCANEVRSAPDCLASLTRLLPGLPCCDGLRLSGTENQIKLSSALPCFLSGFFFTATERKLEQCG